MNSAVTDETEMLEEIVRLTAREVSAAAPYTSMRKWLTLQEPDGPLPEDEFLRMAADMRERTRTRPQTPSEELLAEARAGR